MTFCCDYVSIMDKGYLQVENFLAVVEVSSGLTSLQSLTPGGHDCSSIRLFNFL